MIFRDGGTCVSVWGCSGPRCDSVEDAIADAQVLNRPRLLEGGAVPDEPIVLRPFLAITSS